MANIAEQVKSIIAEKLGVEAEIVTEKANFTSDLGADSLDVVDLIMEFEKTFDVEIPDSVSEEISTVGDAIAFIEANVQDK